MSREDRVVVELDGRELSLSNLDKVLYPATGFTKGDLIAYYVAVGPTLLPHLAGRPVTFKRYPDGVEHPSFFEKNLPKHAPGWIRSLRVPRNARSDDGGGTIDYPLLEELPALAWAANLATVELHAPMWRAAGAGDERTAARAPRRGAAPGRSDGGGAGPQPDILVLDLDPGPPAGLAECCEVAVAVRPRLEALGLQAVAKTSGRKGLQVYAPLRPPRPWLEVRDLALELAKALEANGGGLVISNMRRDRREGRVLVDWSQNHPAKTTVAPYSLRAAERPGVSTPVSWQEVQTCARSGDTASLAFSPPDVLARLERLGDLFASLAEQG